MIEHQSNVKVDSYNFTFSKNKVVPPVFPMKYLTIATMEDVNHFSELKYMKEEGFIEASGKRITLHY